MDNTNTTLYNHIVDLGHGYTWVYTSPDEMPLAKEEIIQQNPNNQVVKSVVELDKEEE